VTGSPTGANNIFTDIKEPHLSRANASAQIHRLEILGDRINNPKAEAYASERLHSTITVLIKSQLRQPLTAKTLTMLSLCRLHYQLSIQSTDTY